jgi:hypothetical protein
MRYKFVRCGDKEALLQRYYREFLVTVAGIITPLVVFLLAFPTCVHAHGGLVVLAFTGLAVALSLRLRSRLKRGGIEGTEWQSYLWRQPLMMVVLVLMAVFTILRFFQVFVSK